MINCTEELTAGNTHVERCDGLIQPLTHRRESVHIGCIGNISIIRMRWRITIIIVTGVFPRLISRKDAKDGTVRYIVHKQLVIKIFVSIWIIGHIKPSLLPT